MRQHLFAIFKPKYSLLLFRFYKKANFNKPFLKKGSLSGFIFDLSRGRKIFCVYGEKSSLIRTRYV